MPWTPEEFKSRHNHGLSGPQAVHASHIANAILRSGAPESIAIATANKQAERSNHAFGGAAGFSSGIMGPHFMGGRPEAMHAPHFGMPGGNHVPHVGGSPGSMRIGVPRPGFDMGGAMGISPSQAEPWWSREEARGEDQVHPGGLVASPTAGRGDFVPTNVLSDAYVMPSDVVAGLGEHNTLAGAALTDKWLHSLPYGIEAGRSRGRGESIPHPTARPRPPDTSYAAGGLPGFREGRVPHGNGHAVVPVRLSGGEYVINPWYVEAIGRKFGGDIEFGHDVLDDLMLKLRAKFKKDIAKLPPPKRD